MNNHRRLLLFEKKPAASGGQKPVGGEIVPVSLLQLIASNAFWIFLLALPIILTYVLAKRGMRLPTPIRVALRMIPVVTRAII